ncbi:GntR family transcriptional regulator [Mycetocola sp. 2940]|uniref:GntR family transcriptional regulator n=1 Tax=Mycetocola sp. 2940 TaxID=3156452 RepID=UPI003391F688
MAGRSAVGADEPGGAVSRVYAHLRGQIVDGEIPPRTKINIENVARELTLSQTPVREALQKLEADGLLDYVAGRGYTTTPKLDLAGLDALFELRFLLEPWAARAVATDRIANPAAKLHDELTRFESNIQRGGDLRQVVLAHDNAFHMLILTATGNPLVRQSFEQSQAHLHLFRLSPIDHDGSIARHEHATIADAIGRSDPDAAERAMRAHLRRSYVRSASAFDVQDDSRIERAEQFPGVSSLRMVD